mmetsp:Transcript_94923/g.268067  ORF Transcript_94923/g.268067 Transcript_94923/m.268067 type:complete len:348 (-) Transcript_94923:111-1154(-)
MVVKLDARLGIRSNAREPTPSPSAASITKTPEAGIGSVLQKFLYNPEHAQQAALEEIQKHERVAALWKEQCRAIERQKDELERRVRDAEVEMRRKVTELEWASVQRTTEYEERIASLEQLLEDTRKDHASERQRLVRDAESAYISAEARVRDAERRHEQAQAAAEARAIEADERADAACRNAEQQVALARAREEARVQEARRRADERVIDSVEQKHFELAQIHGSVVERQRALEETLFPNGKPRTEGVAEAVRHAACLEADSRQLVLAREAMSEAEARRRGVTNNGGKLAELELELHRRTMDRASVAARCAGAAAQAAGSALSPGGALARAGGALLCTAQGPPAARA